MTFIADDAKAVSRWIKLLLLSAQINIAVSNCNSNNCVCNILAVKQKCCFSLKNILDEAVK